MEHNDYKELNTLSIYGELKPDEQPELLHHLLNCPECLADFEEKRKFRETLLKSKMTEPDAALLNQARRELKIALGNEYKKSLLLRMFESLGSFFSGNYNVLAIGTAMAVIGIFAGKFLFNTNAINNNQELFPRGEKASMFQDNTQITNVKFVDNISPEGTVEFSFDAVKPVNIKGNINDPKIQNILSYAMVNGDNAGVRLNSINLINSGTGNKMDSEVKKAIVNVVKNDANPGVRREAFKLLRKIPYDDEIKKALLYVLTYDKNTAMRIEAINLLVDLKKEGHSFNKEDINILKEKLKQDNNQYIQYKVKTVLKEKV